MPVSMLNGRPVAELIATLQKLPPTAVVVSGFAAHRLLTDLAEATFVVQWPFEFKTPPIIAAILEEAEGTHD
jgi:hypothetical protein